MVAGGGLVGGAAGREEEVAVEAVEVGVEEELARLCGDGQTGGDRALGLGELAGGSLRFIRPATVFSPTVIGAARVAVKFSPARLRTVFTV